VKNWFGYQRKLWLKKENHHKIKFYKENLSKLQPLKPSNQNQIEKPLQISPYNLTKNFNYLNFLLFSNVSMRYSLFPPIFQPQFI